MPKTSIYFDHAAASPLRPAVASALAPFLREQFGNPAAMTKLGVAARNALAEARQQVAEALDAHPDEIIFTSGGTESTNLAIQGIVQTEPAGQVLTTAIEHQAVLEPIHLLAGRGYGTTVVPVEPTGLVDPAAVMAAIRPDTRFISVMLANNEIGTIQPISELARQLRRLNRDRAAQNLPRIYLHSDACQAAAYLSLNVNSLGVDALSLNSAKVGGPKGMGVLYVRRGTSFRPMIVGGGQEGGRRAGTENVAAMVGGALAIATAQKDWAQEFKRIQKLRDQLLKKLLAALPGSHLNGDAHQRLPHNISLTIPGIDAEALTLYLDADGVTIGIGAACANLTLEPSHVLKAIGLTDAEIFSTIRITLGWNTTQKECAEAAKRIIRRVRWLRQHAAPPPNSSINK